MRPRKALGAEGVRACSRADAEGTEIPDGPEGQGRDEVAMASPAAGPDNVVDTLVIGAGQAGLATSYWLSRAGVEHQLLERRETLGGAWQDRWDAFCLNTPNFSLALPGMPYDGPAPDAFMLRDDLIEHFRHYAESIDAPVSSWAQASPAARFPRNCSPSAARSTWQSPRAWKHRAGTAAKTSSIG